MSTYKDLEQEAKTALEEEEREAKVALLKRRIKEINATKRTLNRMLKQYTALLETDLDELDVEDID